MSDVRAEVILPILNDSEEDARFKKHTLAMSVQICAAIAKYLEETPKEQAPIAQSIGAACFVASYLIGENFPDERKTQVAEGLKACLALNDDASYSLANLPPQTTH